MFKVEESTCIVEEFRRNSNNRIPRNSYIFRNSAVARTVSILPTGAHPLKYTIYMSKLVNKW